MFVLTYHTGGRYAEAAERLIESGRAHGVEVRAVHMPDAGSWWANVAAKSRVLDGFFKGGNAPLLYLDADCRIDGPLDELADRLVSGEADVYVRHRDSTVAARYNCGVLGVANTPVAGEFLETWAALTQRYGRRYDSCDQPPMVLAAEQTPWLQVADLDPRFNSLPGDGAVPDARIVHFKQSRDDRAVGEWKKAKHLESRLVDQGAAWIKGKVKGIGVVLLVGPYARWPTAVQKSELWAVGWVPPREKCVLWSDNWTVLKRGLAASNVTQCLTPVDVCLGYDYRGKAALVQPLASRLRADLDFNDDVDKPLPPKLRAFYADLLPVPDFAMRDLRHPTIWHAAVHATALRRVKYLVAYGVPERLGVGLKAFADELGLETLFA